ncbi:adipokinetic hormone/corazonin-related peptide receptor variant I [Aethina tumida]|uniref:adipokinetic hormone/corazonin-related peptide receptor variant I n=1 Tax=Aethina tumida TaxID=116153 RepID=UPI00214909F4|nr:adipokinetic hormone/corazonin-related peptide receptor variant I [Aethina tumida]XP_049818025.1 adipokinetic hormone/corazonin-related peptide receptor variant I [Aethina tumida]
MDPTDTNEIIQDHRNRHEWSLVSNGSNDEHDLPIDMRPNDGHRLSIIVYSVLMVFSAIANITVLVLLVKRRRKTPSRINTMLMHLAIADLLVTFLMMPLEIGWAVTVSWTAGDSMCRIMAFFRTFGLYLSSFILVCISVDRFYAVLKPLHLAALGQRERMMLIGAWIGAVLCSIPQTVVFHVESHPNITWYKQCVTYNVFPSQAHELMYNVFGMVMMYVFPLLVIIYSYASILLEIFRRMRNPIGADTITRSSLNFLGKAKVRTLKMTIIIVFVFFVCWTPYNVMCVWYWYDRKSAEMVDQRIQKGLFLFACTNSCMNPIVYGAFNIRARRQGAQAPENNSERASSVRQRDVVCLVSWKKPEKQVSVKQHQDVCTNCRDKYEFRPGTINGK